MEENRNEVTEVTEKKERKIDIVRILKDVGFMAIGAVLTITAAALFGDKMNKADENDGTNRQV